MWPERYPYWLTGFRLIRRCSILIRYDLETGAEKIIAYAKAWQPHRENISEAAANPEYG